MLLSGNIVLLCFQSFWNHRWKKENLITVTCHWLENCGGRTRCSWDAVQFTSSPPLPCMMHSLCTGLSAKDEGEGGGIQEQRKLYYWKEADWHVVGVCQRWSTLIHDLLNSSACKYAHEEGRQRENFTCQNVCVRAKVFGFVCCVRESWRHTEKNM